MITNMTIIIFLIVESVNILLILLYFLLNSNDDLNPISLFAYYFYVYIIDKLLFD